MLTILLSGTIFGQANPWTDIAEASLAADPGIRDVVPIAYRTLHLDVQAIKSQLAAAPLEAGFVEGAAAVQLAFPLPDGGFSTFEVWEAPVMAPELSAKYPDIRSYAGRNRQGDYLRFSVSPMGLHALCLPVERANSFSIDTYSRGNVEDYICFYQRDCPIVAGQTPECMVEDMRPEVEAQTAVGYRAGSCGNLHTYRLALACTGEYANYWGSFGPDKVAVVTAMNAHVTSVNGIFEIDAGLRLILVGNNDVLIFTDPITDPYTNATPSTMLAENQAKCDELIGTGNYDIGHVFGTGTGGIGTISSVCGSAKAKGTSGHFNPGVWWWPIFFAHELGHQFSATHTQYNSCNRTSYSAMEPGNGTTIMSYAISNCPPLVGTVSNYYHAHSIGKIATFINGTGNSCAVLVPNGNSAPTCNALVNKTIPKSTPFILTATASDPDGDALTNCWEQMDAWQSPEQPTPPAPTNKSGPMFRSFPPSSSPSRYFPKFADVLSNTNPTWEVLSAPTNQNRTLNFRVTIRDNHVNGGCTTEKDVVVTVSKNAGPFLVTQPNTAVNWPGNSSQEVKWNVAGTKANGINCNNVTILLTTDGGATFTTLLASTPNDGSQTVTIPNISTTQARIMVQAVGNYFYDISNVDFTIMQSFTGGPGTGEGGMLTVYPNPASGSIQLEMPKAWRDQPLLLRIWDMEGRIVMENLDFIAGNTVDVTSLAKGLYQIEVVLNDEKLQCGFVRE